METEIQFTGSQLETEIRNASPDKLKTFDRLITDAYYNQPDSLYWKEALICLCKKIKK